MNHQGCTVIEALNWASSFLGKNDNAGELLLMHVLGCDRTGLLLRLKERLSDDARRAFITHVRSYKKGVPVQYLIGQTDFYGRTFSVNRHVLIPRFETEELLKGVFERSKRLFPHELTLRVLDIGTGSGVIAITLALEDARMDVVAVDISADALNVAKGNAERLGALVQFVQGDWLKPFVSGGDSFDVIVSNPPYIETGAIAGLSPHVRDHEPLLALDGGEDGLACYRRIIADLPKVVREKAFVAFEVGIGQASSVADWLKTAFPSASVSIENDMNGKERFVFTEIGF